MVQPPRRAFGNLQKLAKAASFGPAIPPLGIYPAGKLAHRPLTTAVLVMAMFADSPGVHCQRPVPATSRRSGGCLQRKGRQSGSCPGAAQPTCLCMCHPQAPLPAKKRAGDAGTWGQGGLWEGVIYVCLLASIALCLLPVSGSMVPAFPAHSHRLRFILGSCRC